MQAGLTTRRLTFRDIFLATTIPLWLRIEVFLLTGARKPGLFRTCTTARSRVATLDGGSTHGGIRSPVPAPLLPAQRCAPLHRRVLAAGVRPLARTRID